MKSKIKSIRSCSEKNSPRKLCPKCPAGVTRLAVVLAAALLFGGLFLLFRDDMGEMIQEEKIKPYVPDFTLLEVQEDNDQEEENTADIPAEAEEKLKEQTQELCNSIDNSVGWINVPETKIDYPVMYSGDQRDAGSMPRSSKT